MATRGGRRPGAGRPKGSRNRSTLAELEAAAALPSTDSPIEFLLMVVNTEGAKLNTRILAAKALMRYQQRRGRNSVGRQAL